MTAKNKPKLAADILCRKAIEQNLGELSQLPEELLTCIFSVYREFTIDEILQQCEPKNTSGGQDGKTV